jgi:radical SAM protein (TIGR01212 family)
MKGHPYRTFGAFLRERFGTRVRKITLDAGLTCPNRESGGHGCIYCNERGSGTGAYARGLSVAGQIDAALANPRLRAGCGAFIAYFQSFSNTYAPIDRLKTIYDTVLPHPEIVGLAIGTRPDCIDKARLELIAGYADRRAVWMEYGLQSASDETLRLIRRGHDVKAFVDAVRLTGRFGLRICAHVIIGLPGEGMENYMATADLISSLPVTDVKIHLLYVIKGTPMEAMSRDGSYRPLTMEGYAEAVARFIGRLRPDMVIQRITGDPDPGELVSPLWALERAKVRSNIHAYMERLGIVQGCTLG